jgi:hypothetical protein
LQIDAALPSPEKDKILWFARLFRPGLPVSLPFAPLESANAPWVVPLKRVG